MSGTEKINGHFDLCERVIDKMPDTQLRHLNEIADSFRDDILKHGETHALFLVMGGIMASAERTERPREHRILGYMAMAEILHERGETDMAWQFDHLVRDIDKPSFVKKVNFGVAF